MDGPIYGLPPTSWTGGQQGNTSIRTPAEQACLHDPTVPQCQAGIYSYILNNHANTAFLLCFIMIALPLVSIALIQRRAHAYSTALLVGLIFEIMGYAARTWSAGNQLQNEPFYMQIVCLTVGPAFMAASIYICMRRIVVCFGPAHSFFSPETYTRLFIPCDLVSLILQATGGGLAAAAHKAQDQPALEKGTNIMIAGLAFQVFTMFIFGSLGLVFWHRVNADHRGRVREGVVLDPNIIAIRTSLSFKAFIYCIFGSTLLIFARCCYRVAELSGGWRGALMKNQTLFIVCEGVFILIASLLLIIAHPALTAKVVLAAGGDFGSMRGSLPPLCCFGSRPDGGENKCR